MDPDDLIDRNPRLLTEAEATCVRKRQIMEEIAETRLMLHVTLLRTVHLHYGRTGFLSEMIYLRQSIAHEVEYLTAASIGTPSHQDVEREAPQFTHAPDAVCQ